MTYACKVGTKPSCYSNNGTNVVNKTEDIQSAKKNVGLDAIPTSSRDESTTQVIPDLMRNDRG